MEGTATDEKSLGITEVVNADMEKLSYRVGSKAPMKFIQSSVFGCGSVADGGKICSRQVAVDAVLDIRTGAGVMFMSKTRPVSPDARTMFGMLPPYSFAVPSVVQADALASHHTVPDCPAESVLVAPWEFLS